MLPPVVIRRPTTRFAYWTGIRRCPCSTKITATMITRPISSATTNIALPPESRIARPCAGNPEITLEKIRIDIPLPIPRCVMSSPIHMIIAVPAVMTSTMSATFAAVNSPGGKMSTPAS